MVRASMVAFPKIKNKINKETPSKEEAKDKKKNYEKRSIRINPTHTVSCRESSTRTLMQLYQMIWHKPILHLGFQANSSLIIADGLGE